MTRPGIASLAVGLGACALVADIERFERGPPVVAGFEGGGVGPGADGGGDAPVVSADGSLPADAPATPCGDCPGTCEADGACILASGLSEPKTIALVGALVVFGEESAGRARACPQSGCTTSGPVVVREGLGAARVVRPERGGGKPALLDRGGSVYELVANGTAPAVQSSLGATTVQLSDTVLATVSVDGVVWCARGGQIGACQQIGASDRPTLALSGSVIAWAGANAGIATYDTANPSAAAIPNQTAAAGATVSLLAADVSAVYGLAAGAVYRWPLDGGQAHKVADVSDTPRALSLDEGHVYLAGAGVRVIDKSSGQVVPRFVSRQTIDVVASEQYVFWLESASLVRAPK